MIGDINQLDHFVQGERKKIADFNYEFFMDIIADPNHCDVEFMKTSFSKDVMANEGLFIIPLGFKLPFMIELSLKLMNLNLIDHIYLDKEKLVNDLWK